MRWRPLLAVALYAVGLGAAVRVGIAWRRAEPRPPCAPGFTRRGPRCLVIGRACPPPLGLGKEGCEPPVQAVPVPSVSISVGSVDWEAEDRAPPRTIHVSPFRIDAFEVTRGQWEAKADDPLRAASGMTREEAGRFCGRRGGRLPTEDEWTVAALSASSPPRRYPWGDTGAVCRRAAWGLEHGPCAVDGTGPDTVGAHPDGDTPSGLHDIAGNVAEWVQTSGRASAEAPGLGRDVDIAKGGSWRTALASDLRVWARLELPAGSRSDAVGLRCAYPP